MSPSSGILLSVFLISSLISPPITTGCWLSTITDVEASLLFVLGPTSVSRAVFVVSTTDDISCLMSSLTLSPSRIWGVISSVMPTSLLSIVLTVWPPVPTVLPVGKGTFWPTTIFAFWLSVVRICGVESTFTSEVDLSAFKKALTSVILIGRLAAVRLVATLKKSSGVLFRPPKIETSLLL